MHNTAQAEGYHAAKIGVAYSDNPYPMDLLFYHSWAAGWIMAMQGMFMDLQITRRALDNMVKERRDLTRKMEAMQAEYDAFCIEMGY